LKHVLVTNDDGYDAPGLAALVDRLAVGARVTVVAPASESSAVAHGITFMHPLVVHEMTQAGRLVGYAVEGTPADCVKIAMLELLADDRPHLVMSGINLGANVGVNVLYSGTVAAALEAAMFGVPAVAVSMERSQSPRFGDAADIAVRIAEGLERAGRLAGALNLNIPDAARDRVRGVRVAPQRLSVLGERFHRRHDPRGRTYFWIDECEGTGPDDEGSDAAALSERYVTVTPLGYDLTDRGRLEGLERLDWQAIVPWGES
jgi:5'-nucleotidase